MTQPAVRTTTPLAADDPARGLAIARSDDDALVHLAVVGDTYTADVPARLLCTVAPAGLERFFAEFGDPVPTRTSSAPELTESERRSRLERAAAKAPQYGIEMLPPDQG